MVCAAFCGPKTSICDSGTFASSASRSSRRRPSERFGKSPFGDAVHVAGEHVGRIGRDVGNIRAVGELVDAGHRRGAQVFGLRSRDLRRQRDAWITSQGSEAGAACSGGLRCGSGRSRVAAQRGQWQGQAASGSNSTASSTRGRVSAARSLAEAGVPAVQAQASRAGDAASAFPSCARGPRACRSAWSTDRCGRAASAPRAGRRHG